MLDEKKLLAIDLLVEGKTTKTAIAEKCGRSRPWLYNCLENKEFKAELDKRLQQIQNYGMNSIKASLQDNIDEIRRLAASGESEKIKLDANIYLVDRVLGKTTSKLNVTTDAKDDNKITEEEINRILNEDDEE